MSLRLMAEQDLSFILEDTLGFGWQITLVNPEQQQLILTGFSNDISNMIDVDTGQVVSGRMASVAIRISTILSSNFALPFGVSDTSSKPWLVKFKDINGNNHTFKYQNLTLIDR